MFLFCLFLSFVSSSSSLDDFTNFSSNEKVKSDRSLSRSLFFEIFEMLWPAGLLLVARSAVATFVARPRLAVAWMDGGSLDRVQKLSSSRLVGNDHHKFRNSIVSVGSFFGEKMKPLFPKMFLKMC